MSEQTIHMEVVPQVSLELHLRGDPPALETIKYSNSADRSDMAARLQQRCLNKAVATILTLFAAHNSRQRLTLFRIHCQQTKTSFVRTVLSAKHEPEGRSQIRDLARGLFLQLFLRPTGPGHYLDIDLTQLRPNSVKIILDGQLLCDPTALRSLAARIAASSDWDLADYRFEINSAQGSGHNGHESSSKDSPDEICFDNGETTLDNPCLAAIRDALRNFCADDRQQLRVGPVRSPAELEDLWAIDSAAYGEASITYEKFQDWWSSFPLGLWALFFRNRIMGAIGLWPLSPRCSRLLKSAQFKESQLIGRTMRSHLNPGMYPGSFCDPSSSDPGQSECSCRKASALGSSLRMLHSLASCWRLPTQPKGKLYWKDSISFVFRMAQPCPIMSLYSAWNWTRDSSSYRC
jgi:hypothetical protein